jgi:hypothetical protein
MPESRPTGSPNSTRQEAHRQGPSDLRHLPARQTRVGREHGYVTSMSNSFGARWFDEQLAPQLDTPEWQKTPSPTVDLLKQDGPPGASSNGFNENLALFKRPLRDVDRRDGGATACCTTSKQSQVASKVDFAPMPVGDDPAALPGYGAGIWACRLVETAEAAEASSPGRPRRITSSWSPRPRAGLRCRRARGNRPTTRRTTEGGALCGLRAERDQFRQPDRQSQGPGPTAARNLSPSRNFRASAPRSARPLPRR